MSFGIKIRKVDTLFSRYFRLQHKRCEKCGRRGEGKDGIDKLQCSHFWGRRNENTRYDEKIVIACVSLVINSSSKSCRIRRMEIKKLGKKNTPN